MKTIKRTTSTLVLLTGFLLLAVCPITFADNRCEDAYEDDNETPFGAAVVIIELTDNDIELQVFADAFDWTRLQIFDPRERLIFDTKARGRLRRPAWPH